MRPQLKVRRLLMLLLVALAGIALWSPAQAHAYDYCYFIEDRWCYYDTGGWCHLNCSPECQGDTSGQLIGCFTEGEDCCY